MIRNWSVYMDQILEKWDEILMTVKTEHDISDIAFNTFLRPLEFYGVTGNTAYILVPSEQLGLSYISKKYYLPLKVAITEITLPSSTASRRFRMSTSRTRRHAVSSTPSRKRSTRTRYSHSVVEILCKACL